MMFRGPWWLPESLHRTLDPVSFDAYGLWWSVQTYLAAQGSPDGVLSKERLHVATRRRLSPAKIVTATAELMQEGLWEDAGEFIRSVQWGSPDANPADPSATLDAVIAAVLRAESFEAEPGRCKWDRSTCPPPIYQGRKLRSATLLGHLVEQTSRPSGDLERAKWCTGVSLVRAGNADWAFLMRSRP